MPPGSFLLPIALLAPGSFPWSSRCFLLSIGSALIAMQGAARNCICRLTLPRESLLSGDPCWLAAEFVRATVPAATSLRFLMLQAQCQVEEPMTAPEPLIFPHGVYYSTKTAAKHLASDRFGCACHTDSPGHARN